MREVLLKMINYIKVPFVLAFLYSVLVFIVLMFGRKVQDEHLRGAFALFPVVSLLIIFFSALVFQIIKEKMKKGQS
jgi:ABC-type multidrug transport system permease subunit